MYRIYLDMCAIQRPLDTQNQIRIILESEAVLGILRLFESGQVEIISSDALHYETQKNPLPTRRKHAEAILAKASTHLNLNQTIKSRADDLIRNGLHALDALHLAFAEYAQADFFCTCDDRLIRRARRIEDLQIDVISPISLIQKIEQQ